MPGRTFSVTHRIFFNETNAMGGVVYFSNFVKWQGMVREAFLTQAVPEWPILLEEARQGNVNMITVEEHSTFIDHVYFGDVVKINIHAVELRRMSFKIVFEMTKNGTDKIIYSGWQKLAFQDKKGLLMAVPSALFDAVMEHSPENEVEEYKVKYVNNEGRILSQ